MEKKNMNACKPDTLLKEKEFHVTCCKRCGRVGMWYQQVLIGFSRKDFESWCSYVRGSRNKNICLQDGDERIVLATPSADINLVLTRDKYRELCDGLGQSLLMLEAMELIDV